METKGNPSGAPAPSQPAAPAASSRPGVAATPVLLLAGLILAVNALLVSPEFFPPIDQVNPFDEAGYVDKGRELAAGSLSPLAESPLSSLLYAPFYLVFAGSPAWFTTLVHAGRVVMFGLLWLAVFLAGRELIGNGGAFVLAGIFLVSTAATGLVHNASDALFTAMSAFCLWQVLAYHHHRQPRSLLAASLFAGLAALSRSDGLILFLVALLPSAVLSSRPGERLRRLPQAVLPFLILVGGYIGLRGLTTGDFTIGTFERTYGAFEQGEWVMLAGTVDDPWIEAAGRAQALYGTSDENGGSVLRAIARNPGAFGARLLQTTRTLPEAVLSAYNKRLSAPLFLLAALGWLALLRQKKRLPAIILLLWPLHLAAYFVTFFREGYLLLAAPVVHLLAAYGLNDGVGPGRPVRRMALLAAGLAALALAGWLTAKPAVLVGALLPVLALAVAALARRLFGPERIPRTVDLLLVLCAGVIVRDGYPFPDYPPSEPSPMQAAILYMEDALPAGANLASYASLPAWASRLTPVGLAGRFPAEVGADDLRTWLDEAEIAAIYVDPALRQSEPALWQAIESEIGETLEVGFEQDPGGFMVLLRPAAGP